VQTYTKIFGYLNIRYFNHTPVNSRKWAVHGAKSLLSASSVR